MPIFVDYERVNEGLRKMGWLEARRITATALYDLAGRVAALESKATKPSSPAIESTEGRPNMSSTYSETWHLVREDLAGVVVITITATSPAFSSTPEAGQLRSVLLGAGWTLDWHEMSVPLSLSGSTPSQTQEEAGDGRIAGIEAAGEDGRGHCPGSVNLAGRPCVHGKMAAHDWPLSVQP